ncbi:MAG: hypothetical protein GY715_12265 [Planctomycetes bacterium]|nr:hypothetical protein [Planctomycetota bacterium]
MIRATRTVLLLLLLCGLTAGCMTRPTGWRDREPIAEQAPPVGDVWTDSQRRVFTIFAHGTGRHRLARDGEIIGTFADAYWGRGPGHEATVRPAPPAAPPVAPPAQPAPSATPAMTNADLIELSAAGLPASIIKKTIDRAGRVDFDLSAAGVLELARAGVSEDVIEHALSTAADTDR